MLKRAVDVVVAVLGLAVASPWLLLIGIAVRRSTRSTALFRQTRAGLGGQPFTLYKFRTMTDTSDAQGRLLPDAQRLTALGRALRATSLDELPQLWNVLRGDMSLVGPRPLVVKYLPRYSSFQARRHEVKPGVTGWVQVKGRNSLTWDRKFEMDVWYVDHRSFHLDVKILWLTLTAVLWRRGISKDGHATMPEFLGSEGVPGAVRAEICSGIPCGGGQLSKQAIPVSSSPGPCPPFRT
jgi:lipopolysaccharide/colanic/teichoic acid biosynthesis glycosyltransferase